MDISNNLYTDWESYRLSDMINVPIVRYGKSINKLYKNEYERYLHDFPNSIASKYISLLNIENCTHEGMIIKLLDNVIQDHKFKPNTNDDIYIHLRLGDIVLADNDVRFNRKLSPKEICINGLLLKYGQVEMYYFFPWSHYYDKLKKITKNGASKKIKIVGGCHRKNKGIDESIEILRLYKIQLEKYGYEVEFKIGGNPDEDFITLSNAKYCIEGGGGYGKLIKNYRLFKKLDFE
jgi:hypothetical protein|uniref:Uncharacterized protein n=1 Tax=viral metagenome TaxID=1070528 RepID=A0A6C0CM14_9ZZZZ